jgi:AraC-like DNA-binding protein
MLEVCTIAPPPVLASFVQRYVQRRGCGTGEAVPLLIGARTDQFIEFYLGETYQVSQAGMAFHAAPSLAVVGPQSHASHRLIFPAHVDTFTVKLQPTALYRLFGLNVDGLRDGAADAMALLGPQLETLRQRLGETQDVHERAALCNGFFARLTPRHEDGIDRAAMRLSAAEGRLPLDAIVAASGHEARRFRALFSGRTGLSPKRFARVARFQRAMRLSGSSAMPLAELAVASGYCDQAHFTRECHALGGQTPGRLFSGH